MRRFCEIFGGCSGEMGDGRWEIDGDDWKGVGIACIEIAVTNSSGKSMNSIV